MSLHYKYEGAAAERLDKVVFHLIAGSPEGKGISRSQLKSWIESGAVAVNGRTVLKAGADVKPGAEIIVEVPDDRPLEIAGYDFALNVLYEDAAVIVINKPPGLSMHPGAGNKTKTLVNALISYFRSRSADLPEILRDGRSAAQKGVVTRPGIVHRLDKDTTGVVVVAKTLAAHNKLTRQFADRTVGRAYQALVYATPRARRAVSLQDAGRVEAGIGRSPVHRTEMSVRREGGRRAATNWKVLERMSYGCLLELKLETGRTHQIRVHMNHIGSPVIGDRVYGNFSGLPVALKRLHDEFGRQALHAFLLEFDHPVTGERLSFSAPIPEDMLGIIESFRKFHA